MDWSPVLTELAKAIPYTIGGLVAGSFALAAQYLTHRYTRTREREKLLREKAEELIQALCQIRYKLFVWHEDMMHQANSSNLREGETRTEFIARRPSGPRGYQDVVASLASDLTRAETLQRQYFPPVKSYLEDHSNTVFLLVKWLKSQATLIEMDVPMDFPQSVVRFYEEDAAQWCQLMATHGTACQDAIEAIAKGSPSLS